MTGLTVRPLRADDDVQGHIARVYTEFGLEFDPAFEDDLLDPMESYRHGMFLVAEAPDGRIVGTAAVAPHGGARVIKRIYIAPEGRRGGLARRLIRECCAWRRFVRTELWSDVRFRNAHRLYLAEGFTQGPTRVLDDPDRSVERYFFRDEPRR